MHNQRGDTLVEVLLAVVILTTVITAAFTLVNRSSRINQNSAERSEAVNHLQFQAEALRLYKENSDPNDVTKGWGELLQNHVVKGVTGPPSPSNNCAAFGAGSAAKPNQESQAFYFNPANLSVANFSGSNREVPNVDRYFVWAVGYRPVEANYVNFYVHGCWQGSGDLGWQQASIVYRMGVN